MGFLSAAIERRGSLSSSYSPKDPALSDLFGFRGNASGQVVTPDTALRTSAVYCCVTVLSETLASFPKHVKSVRQDGGKDLATGHRCYKLLHNRPNRWQSSFEFFEMMEGHRLLRGNAYAKIIFHPGMQMNEVVPMHPDTVYPFVITPQGNTFYLYDNSTPPPAGSKLWYQHFPQTGETEILDSSEVLHVRGYSINGIVGISPIKWAAYQAVGLAMATEEHGARLFSNGAQIGKVLKHPHKLSTQAREHLKSSLSDNYAGSSNAHKTMVLEEGMDIAKIGMTSEESQFLETRKFQVEDIFRIYKVPLMLGASGDKAPTFASAEQFLTLFRVNTMTSNVCRWESALERDLLFPSEVGRLLIDMDMDSLMRGDVASRAAYLKNRFEMASMTPDDIRLYEGENPTGTEEGKELYLQSGMLPARFAGQKPAPKKEVQQ
jgi:HK97 family phage portal protein